MRFNPKARLDTGRVSNRGGGGGVSRGGGLPIPGGMAGGGVGGAIVLVIVFVVVQLMGGGGGAGSAFDTSRVTEGDTARYADCKTGADANESVDCARIGVENSLYDYWSDTLPAQSDTAFKAASMDTFTGSVSTGCGNATADVGPFYCPPDQGIYLDTTFFDSVLERQLGGPDGGFVEAYVLAHEYGHHVQNLMGTMGRVKTQQGPRSDAVRLELQADCYAGMWTAAATSTEDDTGTALISELTDEDVRLAIEAAEAVGDDRIQEKTQGQTNEESWTHGSAASRMKWFTTGFEGGDLETCDTWAVKTP